MKDLITPDYIFESSWEVCNKVGGIYTVLSTRAKTLQEQFRDKVFFIGPDIHAGNDNPLFAESDELFRTWRLKAQAEEGLKVRIGRWNVPGNPVAAFVTFLEFARGALLQMQGLTEGLWLKQYPARLVNDLKKKPGRAEFMRARIVSFEDGAPVVEPLLNQSSADLVMLTQAEVILCLDHDSDRYAKGSIVPIQYLRDAGL